MRVLSLFCLLAATDSLKANSWQRRLDKALLDVDLTPNARIRSLQRVLKDPDVAADLQSAVRTIQEKGFGKGHPEVIEKLWPTGTIVRGDIEGLMALRQQVPETLRELQTRGLPQPSNVQTAPPGLDEVLQSLTSLVTDADKQKELKEELKNGLRSTPKGLETPAYKVALTLDGPMRLGQPEKIEIREYEPFTVARKSMPTVSGGAEGFTTLADYLFGNNREQRSMAMTMPVEVTSTVGAQGASSESSASIAFVLPNDAADAPPTPLTDSVRIERVAKRVVAVKPFPGIVTEEETYRQTTILLEAIAQDTTLSVMDASQVSTLQYNSPLTLPWRRRNELAIVVTLAEAEAEQAEEESVTSWYDSGTRLS